jgi:cytochrome c oxidase subunit II
VACAVVLFVCIAIVAGILRHRGDAPPGDAGHPHRRDVPSGLRWIWIGLGVTVVVLLAAYAGTIRTLSAAARPPRTPALTLDITAHQWWWEVRYDKAGEPGFGFVTANDVHLPVGEPVRVRLHSADVIHSFWIPQLAGKTDVIPGQVNETWLEAREPGTSRGMCAEYCGLQHAVMALAVTAEPPAAFAHWAEAQRRGAAPPATDEVRVGRVVFQRSCGACHAVQGTMALGRMGPDLTHLASRPTIGAGALANTPANLARWIPNAPAIKEGARMPAVPLDAAELRAVVAWLETLR